MNTQFGRHDEGNLIFSSPITDFTSATGSNNNFENSNNHKKRHMISYIYFLYYI